jgi:hypothetical protein
MFYFSRLCLVTPELTPRGKESGSVRGGNIQLSASLANDRWQAFGHGFSLRVK